LRILLDTSVLIDLLRNRKGRRLFVRELVQEGHELVITATNLAEVYAGMWPSERGPTKQLVSALECLPLDCETAELAGNLRFHWARQGRTLHLADTMIAASAIRNRLILLTDNVKDFPMPELRRMEFNKN
jgi:predicted nucleic acid-binding protein